MLTLAFIFFSLFFRPVMADPPGPAPPGGHGSTQNELPGPAAPIDGGLGILLAIGAGYGSYMQYKKRKSEKPSEEGIS